MKKNIPKIREWEGNEKSIPIIRERESEAFILGNGREREFPLTPGWALRSINTKARTECLVSVHLESMSLPELRLRCQGASYQSQTKSAYSVSWSLGCSQLSHLQSLGSKRVRGAVCRLDVGLGGLVTFMTASLGALCPGRVGTLLEDARGARCSVVLEVS